MRHLVSYIRLVDDSSHAGDTYTVRGLTAFVVLVALLPAFVLAPFTHVHLSDHASNHSQLVHSHFSSPSMQPVEKTSISDNDDQDHVAVQLDLFQLASASPFALPALPVAPFGIAPPQISQLRITVPDVRSHDPPSTAFVSFRAPPA